MMISAPLLSSLCALGVMTISGCAVATAGVTKGDERSLVGSINDVNAGRAIRARMNRTENFALNGVDVEVAQGIVLLSGNVPRPEDRIEAERIAWSADKVLQVGNEIRLMGKQGRIRNMKDGALNQSVRARMIAARSVKARNFNIEVHDGIVYLMGVARTEHELAMAAQIASTTRGAQEVVSYVRITGDRSAQTAIGPGYNGEPNTFGNGNIDTYMPLSMPPSRQRYAQPTPQYSVQEEHTFELDADAIESGEPYYLDPLTGERVEIPEGVTPIPYVPDAGLGSLGAGGLSPYVRQSSVQKTIVPYMIDPATGEIVPIAHKRPITRKRIVSDK